jgi:CheY-like chemotaxis protein
LEQEGYAVQTVFDGLAGFDEMRKRLFDTVIADSHVPGLNGIRITWPILSSIIIVSSDQRELTDIGRSKSLRVQCKCPVFSSDETDAEGIVYSLSGHTSRVNRQPLRAIAQIDFQTDVTAPTAMW